MTSLLRPLVRRSRPTAKCLSVLAVVNSVMLAGSVDSADVDSAGLEPAARRGRSGVAYLAAHQHERVDGIYGGDRLRSAKAVGVGARNSASTMSSQRGSSVHVVMT